MIMPFNAQLNIKTSLSFLSVLLVLVLLKSFLFSSTSVAVVDINRIKGQFIRNLAEHSLSDVKMSAATVLFNKALKKSVQDYAKNHHVILVKKGAVLGAEINPHEVTSEVIKAIAVTMGQLAHA